jgi:hypothetical protein
MRLNFTLPAAGLLLLSAIACKKDSSGGKSGLDGNYAFTSTSLKGTATVVVNNPGGPEEKTVTVSDYTSTENKGTVTISGGTMASKNVSYTVATQVDYSYYVDNVKDEDASGKQDFGFEMPTFSSTATFKTVGADSLAFTGGVSTFGASGAAGGKYSISGNILTMIIKVDTSYDDNSQGFTMHKHDVATQTTILTRQ